MALPKRRTSPGRRNNRRSHHALKTPSFAKCSNCGHTVRQHRACPACGYYNRKSVFIPKES